MRITFGSGSARVLLGACAITGATLLVAVGCGGGSSTSGTPSGGSGGLSGGTGGTTTGGDTSAGGTNTGGSNTTGGSGGDTTITGEGGEAGETTVAPPAKDHSAVAFVGGGAVSTSAHFTLIGNIGEGMGGTGKAAKSLQHTFIPGVIAAGSP